MRTWIEISRSAEGWLSREAGAVGLMPDEVMRTMVDVFVDAIAKLELDPAHATATRHGKIRYFIHPHGLGGSAVTHEFFPYDVPADEAIRIAHACSHGSPHLIFPLGARVRGEREIYEAAGYEHTAEWTVMARSLVAPLAQPGDEQVRVITDTETEDRVLRAVVPDGGTGHPTRCDLAGDPAVRQGWIEDGGEAAAFGRLVVLGETAYLGNMVTVPTYRRRGYAAAIARRLLDDAFAAGATGCVLVSTAMAYELYRQVGFTAVMPIVEFRSPGAGDL